MYSYRNFAKQQGRTQVNKVILNMEEILASERLSQVSRTPSDTIGLDAKRGSSLPPLNSNHSVQSAIDIPSEARLSRMKVGVKEELRDLATVRKQKNHRSSTPENVKGEANGAVVEKDSDTPA